MIWFIDFEMFAIVYVVPDTLDVIDIMNVVVIENVSDLEFVEIQDPPNLFDANGCVVSGVLIPQIDDPPVRGHGSMVALNYLEKRFVIFNISIDAVHFNL